MLPLLLSVAINVASGVASPKLGAWPPGYAHECGQRKKDPDQFLASRREFCSSHSFASVALLNIARNKSERVVCKRIHLLVM